jgi:hypothetical protein
MQAMLVVQQHARPHIHSAPPGRCDTQQHLLCIMQVTEPHRLHVERRAAIAAGLAPPPYTSSGGGGSGGGAASQGSPQAAPPRQRDLSTDSPARTSTHSAFARTPPGKLDHATVVAFQVCMWVT